MRDMYYIINPDTKLPAVVAYLMPDVSQPGRWMLNRIEVMRGSDKGQGWGTRLLEHICAEADMNQVELLLGIDCDERPRYFKRLARWYTRHGFTPLRRPLTRANNVMTRRPCAIQPDTERTDSVDDHAH